jgi:hypothetical protein
MMGFELPAVSATIARLAEPEVGLAAYGGIVFPLSLLIEAPIIMLLAASTALSRDRDSYVKLRRFMIAAGAGLTALHLAVAFTPLFDVVVVGWMGAPTEIQGPARVGLAIMTPWTWSIAYRRFQQGVLIRYGRSRVVGLGTAVRLVTNLATLGIGWAVGGAGIVVGTSAVAAGVIVEAAFVAVAVRPVVRALPDGPSDQPLDLPRFLRFYIPLALTSVIALLALPMGSAAMARMPRAIDSLAVWPVVNGLTFTLRSLGFAYNEVVVALLDEPRAAAVLGRFALILAGATTLFLVVFAATPLSWLWFAGVSGLAHPLASLGTRALWISLVMPASSVVQSWFQGILVHAHRTRAVTEAVAIGLITAGAVLLGGLHRGGTAGLYVGLAAAASGALAQIGWLWARSRREVRDVFDQPSP